MTETKVVKVEEIDGELVKRIYEDIPADSLQSGWRTIPAVLAWLANHPQRVDQKEIDKVIAEGVQYWFSGDTDLKKQATISISNNIRIVYEEFQRIAFLKKEPEVPEEIQRMMWKDMGHSSAAKEHNAQILLAFKLGKQAREG